VILKGLKRGDLEPAAVNSLHLFNAKSEKLLEFVQAQLKQNPESRDYLYALAQIAMDNQDFSLAQRALKKLAEIEPGSHVYRLLGDAYHALGDSQLAANAYKEALAH
jgi:HemY protein